MTPEMENPSSLWPASEAIIVEVPIDTNCYPSGDILHTVLKRFCRTSGTVVKLSLGLPLFYRYFNYR